ncbi:hypothetical protein [uncultured Mycobacterium sp.]
MRNEKGVRWSNQMCKPGPIRPPWVAETLAASGAAEELSVF